MTDSPFLPSSTGTEFPPVAKPRHRVKDDLYVERYGKWNPASKTSSGDYLRVGEIEIGLHTVAEAEYQRAKREHPDNPVAHMRPMFGTGSGYGAEILELWESLK